MKILYLNTGSSTVKFGLIETDGERVLLEGQADWGRQAPQVVLRRPGRPAEASPFAQAGPHAAVTAALSRLTEAERRTVVAAGHRIVHGGSVFTASVRITPEVKAQIAALAELAPLHNPVNLEGITAAEQVWPDVPHVAVFDTAFHATLPPEAWAYAIPYAWTHDWQLRRYGFHGLSNAYCAGRAAQFLGRSADGLRLVICHLGNGASVTAVRDGRSVDTSMGFTPLEGLVMGTRSGSVDPGLLLHVLRHKGLSADDLDRVLNHESGLLGVSGVSGDMREIRAAARSGNSRAALALDVFTHRLRQTIGAMTATLGGLDVLVFTAGIGEHDAATRAATCRGLEYLGVELDATANASCHPDADVATATSRVRVLVIATREDLTIVRETARLIREGA